MFTLTAQFNLGSIANPSNCPRRGKKVKQDMKNLRAINSSDNLIKAYPNQFKGIGKFPGTYHMPLRNVDKKLDQLLEQVIVPVTEPTD